MQCTEVVQITGHESTHAESIIIIGGVCACYTNGVFTADGDDNESVLFPKLVCLPLGLCGKVEIIGCWTLSEDWDGIVAHQSELFPSTV